MVSRKSSMRGLPSPLQALMVLVLATLSVTHATTITAGVLNVDNLEPGTYLASQTTTMANLFQTNPNLRSLLNYDYAGVEMSITSNSSTESAQTQVNDALRAHSVTYVEAGFPSTMTSFDKLFIDPINMSTTLLSMHKNLIFLCPSVSQQLTVFTQYLASKKINPSLIILQDSIELTSPIHTLFAKMLENAGLSFEAVVYITPEMDFTAALSTGVNVLVGLNAEASTAVAHYTKSETGTMMILFDEFTMQYNNFQAVLGKVYSAKQDNILLVTNLPQWILTVPGVNSGLGDLHEHAESLTAPNAMLPAGVLTESAYGNAMSTYYADVPLTSQTPAGLRAFMTALVVNVAASHAGSVSTSAIRSTLLSGQTFAVGKWTFGPFSTACIAPEENCELNNGPRDLSLWTYGNLIKVGGTPMMTNFFTSPIGHYKDDYDNIFLWTILGVIALMLLLLLILLLLCCCCCKGEESQSDACDGTVTIVVVEIDDADTVRGVDGAEMSSVVDQFHRTVTNTAEHHACTIVSSSEDRVVLECAKAENAVRFGCAVQDDVRRQRSDAAAEMYDNGEGSNGFVRSMLQVRVGIHSGQRDCAPDAGDEQEMKLETCAASTCSLGRGGGRVLLTNATHKLLPSAADKKYHIEFFGDYSVGDDEASQSIFVITAPVADTRDGVVDDEGADRGADELAEESNAEHRENVPCKRCSALHSEEVVYPVRSGQQSSGAAGCHCPHCGQNLSKEDLARVQ